MTDSDIWPYWLREAWEPQAAVNTTRAAMTLKAKNAALTLTLIARFGGQAGAQVVEDALHEGAAYRRDRPWFAK